MPLLEYVAIKAPRQQLIYRSISLADSIILIGGIRIVKRIVF